MWTPLLWLYKREKLHALLERKMRIIKKRIATWIKWQQLLQYMICGIFKLSALCSKQLWSHLSFQVPEKTTGTEVVNGKNQF
jgi:hypothetical protein